MQHRIVVLGAGYAGSYAAGYLARHLHRDDFAVTVVNAEPEFVERLRLHQVAAGQNLRRYELAKIFADSGARLRLGRVSAIDADNKTVTIADEYGIELIEYDTLLYALGSTAADHGVPGVDEHAFHIAARPAALRLRDRLDQLERRGKADGNGTVLVVGGNLTAIEAATEFAESRPGLRIRLATRGELGGWLGPKARRHLMRAFDRFGIDVHEHTAIEQVTATGAVAADGTVFPADAVVWTAGFAVHPIAAASGIAVEDNGQITVDRTMRSVSHPDVFAAGDSAFVIGENGKPMPMSCASAGYTCMQATSAIIGDLTGAKVKQTALVYFGNHISLGRKDAIFQLVDDKAESKRGAMVGRTAARVKSAVLRLSAVGVGHPTWGMPARKHRLASSARPARAATATAAERADKEVAA